MLVRRLLLPPLLAGGAVLCLLLALALSFGQQRAKAGNPLAGGSPDVIVRQLAIDLEGTPTAADIRRARPPLSERRRLLRAHPYHELYAIAKRRFGVALFLVAAVHYQETGFARAPRALHRDARWRRHREAMRGMRRPADYPNRSSRHPSVRDDFDVVMAIAAGLRARGARASDAGARRAVASRYGPGPAGRLATAMVVERARAWRLIGRLPLPGRGELATPVKGVVGGCGYFGCPRPGHLHNGTDFLAPAGTPVHAAGAGVVRLVETTAESGGYGNFVCLQHRPHLATCYAHLGGFAEGLKLGSRVRRGQVIGRVGSTGSSSAPHLHFEVRRGPAACQHCAVDPLPLLSGEAPAATMPEIAAARSSVTRAATSAATPAVASAPAARPAPARDGDGESAVSDAEPGREPAARRDRPTGGATPRDSAPREPEGPSAAGPAPPTDAQPKPPPDAGDPATGGAAPPPARPAPTASAPATSAEPAAPDGQ